MSSWSLALLTSSQVPYELLTLVLDANDMEMMCFYYCNSETKQYFGH